MVIRLLLVALIFGSVPASARQDRVLFVMTNISEMGPSKVTVGNYQIEVTAPYKVFTDAGFAVDFVSPQGGNAPLYGPPDSDSIHVRKHEDFLRKTADTMKPSQVKTANYSAIFYVGGYGIVFDLPQNDLIANIAFTIHDKGGLIGASGHGPISLPSIKTADGTPLIDKTRVTGFPNNAEARMRISGKGALLPITVEDNLKVSGAIFEGPRQIANGDVVIDNRIFTTMYAFGAAKVAEEMVKFLEKTS